MYTVQLIRSTYPSSKYFDYMQLLATNGLYCNNRKFSNEIGGDKYNITGPLCKLNLMNLRISTTPTCVSVTLANNTV